MEAMASLSQEVGVQKACVALGVGRASFYRWREPPLEDAPKTEPVIPSWSLSSEERQRVLDLLHTDRFVDPSPREVYATMLDEGTYLCSVRSRYRILEEQGEVRERRNQLCRPTYQKPELLARVLGYYQAQRACEMDLLLPLRSSGHLQSLCSGLDGGSPGAGLSGTETDRGKL